MSLQPRTSAPGKARRAASAGKPKRAKKAVAFKEAAPKARHTTAQKAARKGAAAKPFKATSDWKAASNQLVVIQMLIHQQHQRRKFA